MKKNIKIGLFVLVALIVLGIIGALFGDEEETSKNEPKTEEKQQKTKEDTKKDDIKADENTEEVDIVKEEDPNKVTNSFKSDAQLYLLDLSVSYDTIGTLTEAETEEEMMDIIKEGQFDYTVAQNSFNDITPTTDKEKEIYSKLTNINNLTESALNKAETGLINEDVDIINSASDDIVESGEIADSIGTDLQ